MKNALVTLNILNRLQAKGWITCLIALLSFSAGLVPGWLMHARPANAGGDHIFELMVYHTVPGKVPALESIFRDVSKLQAKHHLNVVGYWVPTEDSEWKNTFVYLISHTSREDGEANWKSFHADPAFPPSRKAAEPLIEKVNNEFQVEEVYLRPTDFSAMK